MLIFCSQKILTVSVIAGLIATSGNFAVADGSGRKPTTVSKQIVRMDCDELRVLQGQLRDDMSRGDTDEKKFVKALNASKAALRKTNEEIAALEGSIKRESDKTKLRQLRQELRKAKKTARSLEKDVRFQQRSVSDLERYRKGATNDLRIANKVFKQKGC